MKMEEKGAAGAAGAPKRTYLVDSWKKKKKKKKEKEKKRKESLSFGISFFLPSSLSPFSCRNPPARRIKERWSQSPRAACAMRGWMSPLGRCLVSILAVFNVSRLTH